jgi:hypothetical protein
MAKQFEEVVLHIGTERTGTTSVQRNLFVQRDHLERCGVYVPRSLSNPQDRDVGVANHVRAALAFADEDGFPDDLRSPDLGDMDLSIPALQRKITSELDLELAGVSPDIRKVIISAEHIHSRLATPQSVARLHQYFSTYTNSFRIIIFLRSQVSMAISAGNMQLRRGAEELRLIPRFDNPNGWDKIMGVKISYFDLFALMVRFEASFGREAIRPFIYQSSPDFDSTQIVFHELGATVPPTPPEPRRNTSLDRDAQAALRFLNLNWTMVPPHVRDRLRGRLDWLLVSEYHGRGILPSRGDVVDFMEHFAKGNTAVCRAYFPELETLFEANLNSYPEETEVLEDLPHAARVFIAVIARLLGQ